MRFRIDLKIFLFLILFYLTKQIEIYAMIMVFALIHELGHLLAGIILKMKPEKLEIMPFGVSIAFKIEPKDYNKKIKKGNKLDIKKIIVASAGPLTNLIIIIITYNLKIDMIKAIMVIYTNFLIMLFNLLPIYPLDGGRILSGILHIIVGKQKADDAINNISMISTITITGIKSPNKIYDGNDRMTLTGGILNGVCAGDTVGFTLPSVSYAENKNVGNHKIRLGSNIVLTGQDAYNYTLTQPTYGSITGNIVKRTITVSGVQGKTRKYNKTNVMEIIGGTIVNGVAGDDISLNIPKTGTAESANTGNWKIKIDDIVLQGTDAKNYTLIQPEEVRGTIEKEIGVLKINCDSKIYNKEYSVPYVTENNSTARVTYKFYIEGSDEEIEVPRDVGKYEVVGSMISDGNYTEATTERIKFEITQKDITIVDIVVPNKIYNGTKNFSVTGGKLVGVYGGDDVSFSLPYLGYSESKNIGNYKIKLDDITLNGKQANNYHLIQPTYGSITSNIGKKQISTKGIHAENKKYDKRYGMDLYES